MKMGHIDMASLEKKLSVKLKRNEDSIVPKTNITNPITSFVYPKPKVIDPSPEKICEQITNGMKNSETQWGKNQARCYVIQVVYFKTLEKTMGILVIG
jgi:hypothetical protein